MALQSQMSSAVAGGRALYRALSLKMNLPQRQGVLVPAMLPRPLGAAHDAMLACASLWAAVCGPDGVWPCGGVWPREMRVEGRRRPKMAVVAIVYVAV